MWAEGARGRLVVVVVAMVGMVGAPLPMTCCSRRLETRK